MTIEVTAHWRRVLHVVLVALLVPPAIPSAADPELCVVRALDSRIVAPWLNVPRRASGCSSHGRLGPGGIEVHAIRIILAREAATGGWSLVHGLPLLELVLSNTPQNTSNPPLALLLATDRPVTWRITAHGLGLHNDHVITICKECQLENELRGATIARHDWVSKRALARHANKTWHALTSFTEVHGGNRIELKVGYGVAGEESVECNTSSRQLSPVAAASLTVPQPSQGCLNEDSIGHNPRDVYVVEVQHRGPGPSGSAVQVLLQGEGPRPVPRNVTLVLKGRKPTRWQLGSHGIDGTIIVVSDQQVENAGLDVVVRSKHLPDGLDELLLSVFAEFGRPVLYAKTERASGLRLLVPSIDDERLSGDMAEDEDEMMAGIPGATVLRQAAGVPGATFFSGLHAQESHARPLAELRREMRVTCEPKRMNVSFPRSLVNRLGVRRLALNDPSCVSRSNDTHVWLSSHITSCGSISSAGNGATHYSNSVHVRFGAPPPSDDEDEEASGGFEDPDKDPDKLALICKYLAHFPGRQPIDGVPEITGGGGGRIVPVVPVGFGNIYQMELYRDQEHTVQLQLSGLSPAPAEVQFDETIYVRAWMKDEVRMQVVTDSCWVSNSSDPRYQHVRVPLVRNTCPVDLSVKVEDPLVRPQHGGFSFQVNKAYWQFGMLYVHCKLGVCTQDPAHTRGNLVLCVNQAQHCFRGNLKPYDKMVPTAQQFVSRGPLQPMARRRPAPSVPTSLPIPGGHGIIVPGVVLPPAPTTPPPDPPPEAASVMQGISAEMAAGIALLSFVIGVCLTASMWFIQLRTDPLRQHRSKEQAQPREQQQQQQAAAI